MNKLFVSIVVVFVTIGGLLVFQATRSGTSVVLLPSDLLAHASAKPLRRIRIAGRVNTSPVQYQVQPNFVLRFEIENPVDPHGAVPVVYHGLKPDMFAPGRDIIIDGEYVQGTLIANKLLTQCPSKYEPPLPEKSDYLYPDKTAGE